MLKFATIITAAAVAIAAGPAFAASKMDAKVIQQNGQTLYCVKEQVTGSRLPNNVCLTKQEWEARGAKIASAEKNTTLAANPKFASQN